MNLTKLFKAEKTVIFLLSGTFGNLWDEKRLRALLMIKRTIFITA
jgi:hypothetical protein